MLTIFLPFTEFIRRLCLPRDSWARTEDQLRFPPVSSNTNELQLTQMSLFFQAPRILSVTCRIVKFKRFNEISIWDWSERSKGSLQKILNSRGSLPLGTLTNPLICDRYLVWADNWQLRGVHGEIRSQIHLSGFESWDGVLTRIGPLTSSTYLQFSEPRYTGNVHVISD